MCLAQGHNAVPPARLEMFCIKSKYELKCLFLTFNILLESKTNISLCSDLIFTYH